MSEFNENATAIYKLPGKGERTDHIDLTLGATKITIVFSNTADNADVLNRVENILIKSYDPKAERISA